MRQRALLCPDRQYPCLPSAPWERSRRARRARRVTRPRARPRRAGLAGARAPGCHRAACCSTPTRRCVPPPWRLAAPMAARVRARLRAWTMPTPPAPPRSTPCARRPRSGGALRARVCSTVARRTRSLSPCPRRGRRRCPRRRAPRHLPLARSSMSAGRGHPPCSCTPGAPAVMPGGPPARGRSRRVRRVGRVRQSARRERREAAERACRRFSAAARGPP